MSAKWSSFVKVACYEFQQYETSESRLTDLRECADCIEDMIGSISGNFAYGSKKRQVIKSYKEKPK